MTTIRLTAAQAAVRWLAAQHVVVDGVEVPYFAGCWAIFGHGDVPLSFHPAATRVLGLVTPRSVG